MTDTTILYAGIFAFSLIVLAFILTVREFQKTSREAEGRLKAPPAHFPTAARGAAGAVGGR